jgi:hypothetical protein
VTIAIFDDGGHLLHLHRLDGAMLSSMETSPGIDIVVDFPEVAALN